MTAILDDYARCHGKYKPPLGSGCALLHPACLNCLCRAAPMRDNKLYSFMPPPEFTTTCPKRIAPCQ